MSTFKSGELVGMRTESLKWPVLVRYVGTRIAHRAKVVVVSDRMNLSLQIGTQMTVPERELYDLAAVAR